MAFEITQLIMPWLMVAGAIVIIWTSARIVRPTERGLVERLGRYKRFANPGLNLLIPFVENMVTVNITEQMMEIDTQEIITEDNLNAKVDLVVYYKVKEEEKDVKNSVYKVEDFEPQIVRLAQTTARNVIGTMPFKDVNAKRHVLNNDLAKTLKKETESWGVDIVRVELKDITPPSNVQDTMNSVIQAENTKRAAIDYATAKETEADGVKRANIKEAEGIAQGRKIVADATAYKIRIENEAAEKYFVGNAQKMKQLDVAQASMQSNAKVILGADSKSVLKLFDIGK